MASWSSHCWNPAYHGSGPISDLLVLEIGQLAEDLGSRVLHLQQLQDGGAIVGDGHVLPLQAGKVGE